MKSSNGSICVLLVNKESPSENPVVVAVPPSVEAGNKNAETQNKNTISSEVKVNIKKENEPMAVDHDGKILIFHHFLH